MGEDKKETITISFDRWISLCKAENKLSALEAAGVDNWEGYDYAMEILNSQEED